ncbi:hypothetical protein SCHPADRAFT_342034 [Schizopora paradoxa]|uniref:Uncharacterized protein n=1 Tax=Schizopora paradoxa TaxID=27342 RepID=A0A0H2RWY4_9AGAM|nr:hypothetical protein SCHPADRAFT_342034 [Schizopora paradoxa]
MNSGSIKLHAFAARQASCISAFRPKPPISILHSGAALPVLSIDMAMEFSPSQQRMSKASMVPPLALQSARDSVRNSVLQVRNLPDSEYQQPPPPFSQEQGYYEDEDVEENMDVELDPTHASLAGAQNGYASGVAPEEVRYYEDDRGGYGRRDTYDDGYQGTQASYPAPADFSPIDPEVRETKNKKKWKGRVGGMFKGFKRRLFRRGRPTDAFLSDDVAMGQRAQVPDILVHSDHGSRHDDRPRSRASASYNPQRPGLGVVNDTTYYSAEARTDTGAPSQPVTMMYIDPDPTDSGLASRSRRQSYAPPTRQASLKRDEDVDDGGYQHPDDIHRSASHVSHVSQRSHLSDPSTARNVHRERVPNPQIPSSLIPSTVQMPYPMPYIAPAPPPPSARKTPSSSRHTSRSRSYFSSEISSPVGHLLHMTRLVRDIRQMPWLATGGRITSGYVPKFSSARAKERMSRSRRVQAEMERIAGAGPSWYTPSPKQRAKMEKSHRRREKYLKHHDHDHDGDAGERSGKGGESSRRRHHEHHDRHLSSNSTTSPGHSTPSRRRSSKARRHRSSFRNGFPYYMPSTQNAFAYPSPYGMQPMYMIPSPPNAFQPQPGPSSGRPLTAVGTATAPPNLQGLAPPDKGRASRPASVASRMTVTQDSHRRPGRELPIPPQPQAQAVYMIPTFLSPPGSPVPSGQAGIPFPQPMPFPYPPPSAWTGVPPPSQQPNPA